MALAKEKAASPCQGEAAQKTKLSFDPTPFVKPRANLIQSEICRWKAKQRLPRGFTGKRTSGGKGAL